MSLVKCQVNLKTMLHSSDIFIQDVTAFRGIKEERVADRPVTEDKMKYSSVF